MEKLSPEIVKFKQDLGKEDETIQTNIEAKKVPGKLNLKGNKICSLNLDDTCVFLRLRENEKKSLEVKSKGKETRN